MTATILKIFYFDSLILKKKPKCFGHGIWILKLVRKDWELGFPLSIFITH
jgi:hypothetical protein